MIATTMADISNFQTVSFSITIYTTYGLVPRPRCSKQSNNYILCDMIKTLMITKIQTNKIESQQLLLFGIIIIIVTIVITPSATKQKAYEWLCALQEAI